MQLVNIVQAHLWSFKYLNPVFNAGTLMNIISRNFQWNSFIINFIDTQPYFEKKLKLQG